MIIDFHTHVFPSWVIDDRDQLVREDPCFAQLYANPKAKLATTEELIASMDQAGVDLSVILNIGWVSHELCIRTNNHILESVSRYSDRLVGFCSIQPKSGEAAIDEIERCSREGIRGIGETRSDIQGFDLGDESLMKPVVQAAIKHRLILLTHSSEPVGHRYSGKGTITPDTLYQFISNFPDLQIVCAHWGGGLPFYTLMPEVGSALKNVFFDTAASPLLYRSQIFRHVAQIAGADRILFGSDYPLLRQSRMIADITSLGLSQDQVSMILGGNAKRLLTTDNDTT